jgi:SNF2 family DNA or RNA helicase
MGMQVTQPAGHKILYFCPATMLGNVEREFKRWAPHRTTVVLGGKPKALRKFLIETMLEHPEYVIICNYEAWRKDKSLIEDLIDIQFDTCIIDEAHNVKDRKSNAYRGIREILDRSSIPFILPMTGTPILNRPQEFYTLLTLVDSFHFPNTPYGERMFLRDYCIQDENGKWGFQHGGVERLFKKFSNLFLRRTREQAGIVLPPKTVIVHDLEVDTAKYPKQAYAREQMRKWGSIMLDPDNKKALSALAEIAVYTRLRQIETWPAAISVKDEDGNVVLELGDEYAESQKVDELIHWENGEFNSWEGLIPEVCYNPASKDGERCVVFSQFKAPLEVLRERLVSAGYRVAMMVGGVSDEMRNEIMVDFDAKETTNGEHKYDIVLCHYKVGGVGMNLTNATQMFILDEEWNPGKRDQAYDRIHRMGQEKPVTIHVLRDAGTIDVWLANLIDGKEAMVNGFHETADVMAQAAYDALKSGLI